MVEPSYLNSLNREQKEAVLHSGGPLLILAGAGSGKTRVITTKIAYLIDVKGVPPWSILAVTFTNKAAAEMRERVGDLTPNSHGVMIKTFHSFGAWLLRRNSHLLGLGGGFTIYDDEDSIALIRSIYNKFDKRKAKIFANLISRAKDYGLPPGSMELDRISVNPEFREVYTAYERRLREIGNVDFGDLILRSVELLRGHTEVRERLRQRFKVVMVDEYQDSNVAQYELLKLLSGPQVYTCVVGDDDQSIYMFRGAEVQNILSFEENFPGTSLIRLEQNYRSTGRILETAARVISNNVGRLGKTLHTSNPTGTLPTLTFCDSHDEEAEYCRRVVEAAKYDDTAILYRTNAQSVHFETCLARHGIPYKIVGSHRFYDREEIKDILAYLSLYSNPRDEISFRRIVNKPTRGIGKRSIELLLSSSRLDLWGGLKDTAPQLSAKATSGLQSFMEIRLKMKQLLTVTNGAQQVELSKFIEQTVRLTGLLDYYTELDQVASTGKVDNLEQLIHIAEGYPPGEEGLGQLLEDLELDRSLTESAGSGGTGVTLITIHNTKGLEFNRVIVTGMEEGIFPGSRIESEEELEEERRLLYVAVTRARWELFFTSCRSRLIWGRWNSLAPSSFIRELPEELFQVHGRKPQNLWQTEEGHEDSLPLGARVYHDDYGSGVVSRRWTSFGELHVEVNFESGRSARFIPRYTPLERIADDRW